MSIYYVCLLVGNISGSKESDMVLHMQTANAIYAQVIVRHLLPNG